MSTINSDEIAIVDELGRDKFAEQIVKSLMSSFEAVNESIVIGICGQWGSGKSTLLSFIKKHLDDAYDNNPDKYQIIIFNSWANTGTEEIERSLLEAIIIALETIKWKEPIEDANNTFKKYLKYLNYLKFAKHIHPIAKSILEAVDEYTNQISVHSINEIKQQADQLVKEKEIKLYILVDDINRLSPEEITSLFKVIKLNINFINTFFLIAYDKEVVINALKNQYGKNGEKYLEKIIQADFFIPQLLDEQIEQIFFRNLKNILSKLNIEYEEGKFFSIWKHYGLREYFNNLRDIKRYFNSLIFSLPNIGSEINIYDFVGLEAIKTFDHEAYEKLYLEILITKRRAVWTSTSFDTTAINKFENLTTQSLLNYLFINDLSYGKSSLSSKRLKDTEFFQRYFTLYISSKDITEEILKLFFTDGSDKQKLLQEILQNERMKNFLRRLEDADLNKYYKVNNERLFYEFLQFWETREPMISSELDEYIWNSYFNLAHSFEDKFIGARTALRELILNPNSLQPMRFVFNYFINLFKSNERNDSQFYALVYEQMEVMFEELRKNFLEYLENYFGTYFYQASRENPNWVTTLFIYSFAKYCPEKYLPEAERYFVNPNFLSFYVKSYFFMWSSENKPGIIKWDSKSILLPDSLFDKFIQSLKDIKKGALNKANQENVDFFLKNFIK